MSALAEALIAAQAELPTAYTISLAGTLPNGRESWSASCGCGWFIHGQVSDRAARKALERHHCHDARHAS